MPFYDDTWEHVEASSRAFPPRPGSLLLLWISPDGERHCLVPCSAEFPERSEQVARALRVSTRELELVGRGRGRYVDIQCLDSNAHRLFDYFIHDLEACSDILAALDTKLDDYRHFWSRPSKRFTSADAVGLFGEVWFMEEWLSADVIHGFEAWTGAELLLHDFSWSNATVEVKTTRGGLPATHKIGSLEQLTPQDGRPLFLFSLAVRQDPSAGTFLSDLLEMYRDRLVPHGLSAEFDRFISARGYRPDDPENETYRYILRDGGERLYEVRDNFPRILGASFVGGAPPGGVGGISYEITLAGYDEYISDHRLGFNSQALFGVPSPP